MHLELGGKAPVVVFDDADIESVVEWVSIAGYFNAGQDCTAACRVLVTDASYDKVLADLVPAVEGIKVGGPFEDDVAVGSMISKEQQERVEGFVDRAKDAGAEVLTGGEVDGPRRLLLQADRRREPVARTPRSSRRRSSAPW